MDPSVTEKSSIKLIQKYKTEVIVEARVASWKLANHFGSMKNTGQMSFKSIESAAVNHIDAIVVSFSPNDAPSGTIYVVRLEQDKKTGLAWGTNAEGQNIPLKKVYCS